MGVEWVHWNYIPPSPIPWKGHIVDSWSYYQDLIVFPCLGVMILYPTPWMFSQPCLGHVFPSTFVMTSSMPPELVHGSS